MVHGALRRVDQWQQQLTETLDSRAPPPDYIPGCFPDQQTSGPPINKYRFVDITNSFVNWVCGYILGDFIFLFLYHCHLQVFN